MLAGTLPLLFIDFMGQFDIHISGLQMTTAYSFLWGQHFNYIGIVVCVRMALTS
jgi:hypothetical protein